MTTAATALAAQNRRLADTEYQISLERLSELNRSPAPLLLARLNSACPSYGKTPAEADDPTRLMSEIRRHCRNDADFIRQEMPLQEIVFRTMLLHGDEPIPLGILHQELTERWSSPLRPITVTVSGLARILDHDVFYGFESLPEPEPEPELELESEPEFDAAPMLDAPPTDAELARLAASLVSNLDDADDADDDDEDDDDLDLFDDDGDDGEDD